MFFWDGTIILLIPAMLFALWAQFMVKSAYKKYARVGNRAGLTGADVAKLIMRDAGLEVTFSGNPAGQGAVGLQAIPGQMTDHYDPRDRTLRLSEDVFHGSSVAALGIAAHEVGHAIQHAKLYSPLMLRNVIYPISSLGSSLAFPLFFIGLFLPVGIRPMILNGALLLFALAVFFTLLTLPVEFNASRRAMKALSSGGYLQVDELKGARKVLTAAAMTYVAAAAMAILQLVRMILIAQRR